MRDQPVRPACMSEREWRAWWAANLVIVNFAGRARSPCEDCLSEFAAEMRAERRCDGRPGRKVPSIR